jgi:hypothetical protein
MIEFIDTTTSDGFLFSGVRTVGKPNKTVIVDIHGLSWDFYTTHFYKHFYNHINETGVDFMCGETRGSYKIKSFGKNDGTYVDVGGALEIFEDSILDTKAWIDKAESLGYTNIILSGYSLGPAKTSFYFRKTQDPRIKGLIFYSPSDIHGLVNEPNEKPRHERLILEAKELIKNGHPTQILNEKVWDIEIFSAQTYLSLFDNPNTKIFNYLSPEFGFETLACITVPVLAFTGTADEGIIVCRDVYESIELLKNALIKTPYTDTVIIENATHNFDGFESLLLQKSVAFAHNL